MLIEHLEKRPRIHSTAYVAPNAVICGNVSIGENTCVLFGAAITAEGGAVSVGSNCIVMENSVIRGSSRHQVSIDGSCLIGPRAYLSGCTVEDDVFLATGTTVFNGSRIETRAEVRINGVVHLKTDLPPDTVLC